MKTRIFSFIAALFLCAGAAQAQETSFAIRGGVNFQNINGDDVFGDRLDNDIATGYHVGINVQFPIGTDFVIQPGLALTSKGAQSSDGLLDENSTTTVDLSYLEAPIDFVYKPYLGSGRLLLGFGPYVGYGLNGKVKFETETGTDGDTDIDFKNEVTAEDSDEFFYLKRLDAGANLLFGYEFAGGLFAQANAQLGLVNINPDDVRIVEDKSSSRNTGFGLSLGYRF